MTLRIVSTLVVVAPSFLISFQDPMKEDRLILVGYDWIVITCLGILVFVVSGSKLDQYRQISRPKRPVFSVMGFSLLTSFWIFLMGIVTVTVAGILIGLLFGVISLIEYLIAGSENDSHLDMLWWGHDTRLHYEPLDDDSLSRHGINKEDMCSLSIYLLGVILILTASFLVLRERYDLWQGVDYLWIDNAAFIIVALFAIPTVVPALALPVVLFLTLLMAPKRNGGSGTVFCTRFVTGSLILMAIAGCIISQLWDSTYSRYHLLGALLLVMSSILFVLAVWRLYLIGRRTRTIWKQVRTPRRHIHSLRSILSYVTPEAVPILYAAMWLVTTFVAAQASENDVPWTRSPEFALLLLASFVESCVSVKSIWERNNGADASWESTLNPYRQAGIVFLLFLLVMICCGWSGSDDASNPFSDVGLQILLGVVTVEYYIAFRAALRNREEDKPREKKLQQRMYL